MNTDNFYIEDIDELEGLNALYTTIMQIDGSSELSKEEGYRSLKKAVKNILGRGIYFDDRDCDDIDNFIGTLDSLDDEYENFEYTAITNVIRKIVLRFIYLYQNKYLMKDFGKIFIDLEVLWAWTFDKYHNGIIFNFNVTYRHYTDAAFRYPIQMFYEEKMHLKKHAPLTEPQIEKYFFKKFNNIVSEKNEITNDVIETDFNINFNETDLSMLIYNYASSSYTVDYYSVSDKKHTNEQDINGEDLRNFLLYKTSFPLVICEIHSGMEKLIHSITLITKEKKITTCHPCRKGSRARPQAQFYLLQFFKESFKSKNGHRTFQLDVYQRSDLISTGNHRAASKYKPWTDEYLEKYFTDIKFESIFSIAQRPRWDFSQLDISPEIRFETIHNICLIKPLNKNKTTTETN